ncbi:reverse transcriptase domain-containing protein [Clostridium sp. UBA1056]|uniref:reverse transcriptase domain-containing protein n=1 Tax=unclassified Clostridium TaxID=2614128 RepID=UPI0032170FD0
MQKRIRTPQGRIISPILENLFLHYAFEINHPDSPWVRYADDAVIHFQRETIESLKRKAKRM